MPLAIGWIASLFGGASGKAVTYVVAGLAALGVAGGLYLAAHHVVARLEASIVARERADLTARQADQARAESEAARAEDNRQLAAQIHALITERDQALARAARLAKAKEAIDRAPAQDRDRPVGPVLRSVLDELRQQRAAGAAARRDPNGQTEDPGGHAAAVTGAAAARAGP